jgi:hypothetical protein
MNGVLSNFTSKEKMIFKSFLINGKEATVNKALDGSMYPG